MSEPVLEPLVTGCPDCGTRFRVTPAQLDAAGGRVRCGICNRVFVAADSLCIGEQSGSIEEMSDYDLDQLLDELESHNSFESETDSQFLESFEEERDLDTGQEPDLYTDSVEEALKKRIHSAALGAQSITLESDREIAQSELTAQDPTEDEYSPVELPHVKAQIPDLLPSVERSAGQLIRPLTIATAAVLISVQVLWFQFDEWSNNPDIRPLYARICAYTGCVLPARRSLAELYARNVVIRPHESKSHLLVVDAIIVNNADFPQRFPLIDMRFSSVQGLLVTGRKVTPEEYLQGDAVGLQNIGSKSPVHVRFEIDNPGPEGPNFDLNLL